MKEQKTGLVIRTAFNNQGWTGRCKKPLSDYRCNKCLEGGLFINEGKPIWEDETGTCEGQPEDYPLSSHSDECVPIWCWEQVLCKKFFWGNVKGKWRSVFEGMPVYFVFTTIDGTLTLWGHSVIDRIDNDLKKYPPIFFKPFKPMPTSDWVPGLTGHSLTGKKWGQLNFRYLDENHEKYLAALVKGEMNLEPLKINSRPLATYESLSLELRKDIKEKLLKIASNEGREIEDVAREAIAKLIRERGI